MALRALSPPPVLVDPSEFPTLRDAQIRNMQLARQYKQKIQAAMTPNALGDSTSAHDAKAIAIAHSRLTQLECVLEHDDMATQPVTGETLARMMDEKGKELLTKLEQTLGGKLQEVLDKLDGFDGKLETAKKEIKDQIREEAKSSRRRDILYSKLYNRNCHLQ
ncbi:hypothetical protein PENSPDRAFT_253581 [Peniophora sp. CONT]|nr:hypothetical protein PENSPDRAFT_253581 [Peniophora sp. CONT]